MAANSMLAAVYLNLPAPNSCLISSDIARNLQVGRVLCAERERYMLSFHLDKKKVRYCCSLYVFDKCLFPVKLIENN